MSSFIWQFGLVVLGIAGILVRRAILDRREKRRRLAEYAERRGKLEDHFATMVSPESVLPGYRGETGIAIDWQVGQLLVAHLGVLSRKEPAELAEKGTPPEPVTHAAPELRYHTRRIAASDLIRFTIVEDRYLKTNKTGGKRKQHYRRVELKINVADRFNPVVVVPLFIGDEEADHDKVRSARDMAVHWEGMLQVLLHKVSSGPSVEQQLAELTEKLRRGEVTEADFRRDRARLKASKIMGNTGSHPRLN